jgi:hypothetical protein
MRKTKTDTSTSVFGRFYNTSEQWCDILLLDNNGSNICEFKNGVEVMRQCDQKVEAGHAFSEVIFCIHAYLDSEFQTSEENFSSGVRFLWQAE